jgi:hypothetical protein
MNDRELLEAAARAAGIEGEYRTEHLCVNGDWLDVTAIFAPDGFYWNSLTDDGDALRLAVTLGIMLDRATNRCWTFVAGMAIRGVCEEFYGSDPYAATRRAITRAAAMTALASSEELSAVGGA